MAIFFTLIIVILIGSTIFEDIPTCLGATNSVDIISLTEINRLGLQELYIEYILFIIGVVILIVRGYYADSSKSKGERNNDIDIKLKETPSTYNNMEAELFFSNVGDEKFSSEKMCTYAEYIFTKLQKGWVDRNMEKIIPFVSDDFFKKQKIELEKYKLKGYINKMKLMVIRNSYILNVYQTSTHDVAEVFIKSSAYNYTEKETTGKIVEGNKNVLKFNRYKMIFIRNKGLKTKEFIYDTKIVSCPNCRASIDILKETNCEYCDSKLIAKANEWVLNDMDKIG